MDGQLFIVSAPSGAGKTSLVRALLRADPTLSLSVSYTTRAPRPGGAGRPRLPFRLAARPSSECSGAASFWNPPRSTATTTARRKRGSAADLPPADSVILEIDWQGAAQIRQRIPEAIGIFIMPPPPPLETLAQRLRARNRTRPR